MKHIEVLDTTLRDGAQSAQVTFSLKDKLSILALLDDLGVEYAECGNPGANDADMELFERLHAQGLRYAVLSPVAFTSTCEDPDTDMRFLRTMRASFDCVSIVGKASTSQVTDVLRMSPQENLDMITRTISAARARGKHVFFSAEHFFDGCRVDESYAFESVRTAIAAGACTAVLCDTNGGMMPEDIAEMTKKLSSEGIRLGIHCHNDCGLAVANSLTAVRGGACHVQGTFCGIGERCGNADLCVVIPDLQLKLSYDVLPKDKLCLLASTARAVADFANISFNERTPYVGQFAFSHKAGMHIDGFLKEPHSFEHISPECVGNRRRLLLSGLAGRAAVADRLTALCPDVTKNSDIVEKLLERIKKAEAAGYQYDNSDGSLMLLLLDALGRRKKYFELLDFKVVLSDPTSDAPTAALIKIKVGDTTALEADEGSGPVNAMDKALRKALEHFYPQLKTVRLADYRVRVIDPADATNARVRVLIDSTDSKSSWRTIGVSRDIIEASWEALCESFDYKLSQLDGLL